VGGDVDLADRRVISAEDSPAILHPSLKNSPANRFEKGAFRISDFPLSAKQ
jgi:hypothetical protein